MKLMKTALAALTVAGLVAASSSVAMAQKKKAKCKDGETTEAASFSVSKGENLDFSINASLTGKAGDATMGLKWMTHRRLGNCIACHQVDAIEKLAKPGDSKSLKSYGFHGKIGPQLDGAASRYTEGELRMLVVNSKKIFPETIMPGYHNNKGLTRVHKDCVNHVILTAQRVEDVVAYLKTLK